MNKAIAVPEKIRKDILMAVALVDMRNETVHTYNEEIAERIYKELPAALELFKTLSAALRK